MVLLFSIVSAIGIALTTLQTLLTAMFRRRSRFFAPGLRVQAARFSPPAVSILKPLCGLEDDLETNLESFACLRGVSYEVLLSVADPSDPAVAVVRRTMERFPRAPFRLILGGDPALENGNRKIARLIAAAPHARGEILFISDANVRVRPDDIAGTIEAFRDPRVGCVSNLFTGAGAASFGAEIESLHLLSFVVTGNVLAALVGVPCVVGKSMAISRAALQAIGGFERFANVLAEDQAIGLAVKRAGFDVVLSPVVVRNIVTRRSLKRAIDRQIRWDKIRYAFSRPTYAAEFLLNPLPFAILAALLGGSPWIAVAVALIRILQIGVLAETMQTSSNLLLVPLLDLLQFGAQFVPFVNNRVTWRGYTARLGAETVLLDVPRAA